MGIILGDRTVEKLPVFVTIKLYVNINDAVTELDLESDERLDSDGELEADGLELNNAVELGKDDVEEEYLALELKEALTEPVELAETLVEPVELAEALAEPVDSAEPESTLEDEGVKEFVTVCPKALVVFDAEGVCVAMLEKEPFAVFVEYSDTQELGVYVSK